MEKKQLNFSAPLLSVRRISSPMAASVIENREVKRHSKPSKQHPLPVYRTDLKQDQDSEPGAVPFVWEHAPGRAKGHSGPLPSPRKDISITPRLPPGRVLDFVQQPVEKESGDQYVPTSRNAAFYANDRVIKWEGSKERVDVEHDSDSESGDDAYSDALDTLSPGESCSWSCDVSDLSGSDGPDVKPSGTFSADPQTRNFMMERFLPAAKAVTLETPLYASRKQPVAPELPRYVKKDICGDKRPLLTLHESNILPPYCEDVREEESDDEDDNYCDDSGNIIAKACGLVPKFSLKNSLCLMNPVPGMRTRFHSPKRAHIKHKSVSKLAWNEHHKHKLDHVKSLEPYGLKHKLTTKFNQLEYHSNLLATNRSFPYKYSRDGRISPYRNQAPRSSFEGKGFLGIPKEVENLKDDRLDLYAEGSNNSEEVLHRQENNSSSDSRSPVVEKTLYIDSVNSVKIQHSYSSSSDTKGLTCSADEDFKDFEGSKGMEETVISEISILDIGWLNDVKGRAILKSSISGPLEAPNSSSLDMAHLIGQIDTMDSRQDPGLEQKSLSVVCFKEPTSGNPPITNEQIIGSEDQENSTIHSLLSSLPPPLPKSPSESWLRRALPSIPSKKLVPHSYIGSQSHLRKQAPVTAPTGTKWETIVKTSNLHKNHVRYSEELITHVSQQSKP